MPSNNVQFDAHLRLNYSYRMEIESAYVITLQGNTVSEELAQRCLESCAKHQMPAKLWPAFDGTSGDIHTPAFLKNKDFLKYFKILDPQLSPSEVACALSHISLWAHCVEQDQPLIVLEHDAIVVAPFQMHPVYGCIVYLGCEEQMKQGWAVLPTPPHGTHGSNYHFMCRAHAYSIDPAVAKLMLAYVIRYGICESLDLMLRADVFPIVQFGLVAYDNANGITTITQRKKDPQGHER